jgi:3-deoxy-D-manno-octulosonic-acid transferase
VPELHHRDLPPLFQELAASDRPVLIAASTREDEEEKVLEAFAACLQHNSQLLLVLVPRHPERFNQVARLCEKQNLHTLRRSTATAVTSECQVLLGDSMGEMWFYFALADIAFVGGSLVNTGCHNVLEPAALGIPVITGPSQFNFATICKQLEESGALKKVANEQELAEQVLLLLGNSEWRKAMGSAGKLVTEQNRGALLRLVELIDRLIPVSS